MGRVLDVDRDWLAAMSLLNLERTRGENAQRGAECGNSEKFEGGEV
jgi:hypothetical protein